MSQGDKISRLAREVEELQAKLSVSERDYEAQLETSKDLAVKLAAAEAENERLKEIVEDCKIRLDDRLTRMDSLARERDNERAAREVAEMVRDSAIHEMEEIADERDKAEKDMDELVSATSQAQKATHSAMKEVAALREALEKAGDALGDPKSSPRDRIEPALQIIDAALAAEPKEVDAHEKLLDDFADSQNTDNGALLEAVNELLDNAASNKNETKA